MKVLVLGGGAAGFFAALSCKSHHPDAHVIIIEKSGKVLSKVKISGGGRCNVTNAEQDVKVLASRFPRGERELRKLFGTFNTRHVMDWFEARNVPLKTYPDGCVFPLSNDSQTIVDCFSNEAKRAGIQVLLNHDLKKAEALNPGIRISFEARESMDCDKMIVATGGHPKLKSFAWLLDLGHKIEDPVPSLFTFNMPSEAVRELMGVVVNPALARIQGTRIQAEGPLLITHWGMSGPAILKLSAWGARILNGMNYKFKIQVSWVNDWNEDIVRSKLESAAPEMGGRMLKNLNPFALPARLWVFLLNRCGINPESGWDQMGSKMKNRLINTLVNDLYEVSGKTTFREEFVTCGGVSLSSIHMATLESKVCPGMYFAGEVMDIDGITGGFNFQSAWTTGYIAGKLL